MKVDTIKILLIDDDEEDYILIRDLLEEVKGRSFEINWIRKYNEALNEIDKNLYDVCLLDYRLGANNGLELLQEASSKGCKKPMIFLTGQGNQEIDIEAMKAGAADYLIKGQADGPLIDRSIRYAIEHASILTSLEEERNFISAVFDTAGILIVILDSSGKIVRINRACERITQYTFEDLKNKYFWDLFLDSEEITSVKNAFHELHTNQTSIEYENYWITRNGIQRLISWTNTALSNADNTIKYIIATGIDITQQRQTEKALDHSKELLRQSQKMEAIGRLAGGVAHDFNNLLTTINGYSELIIMKLKQEDPLRKRAEEIKKSGDRAAALVRQLLIFSRKQVLQFRVIDLNEIITDITKMLERLIGESVELIIILDPTLGHIRADPGQIEQILMNLVVNARDAMPNGGKLIVRTLNIDLEKSYVLEAGPYIELVIKDSGCGMSQEVLSHIFEPFYTTKDQTKGTGLGLSTVYGIVKQSNGYIQVESQPDQGSAFQIFLPRINDEVDPTPQPENYSIKQSNETILLVEDEKPVRELAREILIMSGFNVLEATNAGEALLICEEYKSHIHVMLTDVVMPRMGGRKLAERLLSIRPEMAVLYMSGYTDDDIICADILKSGTPFLEKPFTPNMLIKKIREVLRTNKG